MSTNTDVRVPDETPETTGNLPAYPCPIPGSHGHYPGLSKRELGSFMLLSGMLADSSFNCQVEIAAELAVRQTDALIKALEETP